jgi:hypothetical protein
VGTSERGGWRHPPALPLGTALSCSVRALPCGSPQLQDLPADIIAAIDEDARVGDEFTSHVLRRTFGTTLVRDGHDLVLVAELMGHARQRAINSLPTDR